MRYSSLADSLTYLRDLELPKLKEEDMPLFSYNQNLI